MQELTGEQQLELLLNHFQMFSSHFTDAENSGLTRLHTWSSLKRKDGFYDGLVFNVIAKPISFSSEQIQQLQTLFGELVLLKEEDALEPINRSAEQGVEIKMK